MIFALLMRLAPLVEKHGGKAAIALLTFLFFCGWGVMMWFEPTDSKIRDLGPYAWWYIVTVATVGYGDYTPLGAAGRTMAAFIIYGGIASFSILLTQATTHFVVIRELRRRGMVPIVAKNHILIIGLTPRTDNIIDAILEDEDWKDRTVVICCTREQINQVPSLPDNVMLVSGSTLTDVKMLQNASISTAHGIIIDTGDDNVTLAACLAVERTNASVHMVAAVMDMETGCDNIHRVDSTIECVPAGQVPMIAQVVRDPGLSRVYQDLMSSRSDPTTYSSPLVTVREGMTAGELFTWLKQQHNATLMALGESSNPGSQVFVNPAQDMKIRNGMTAYYIGDERLTL